MSEQADPAGAQPGSFAGETGYQGAAERSSDAVARDRFRRTWITVTGCLVVGLFLVAVARVDYLAFHLLTEVSVAVVLLTIFAIAWHTRRLSTNGYLTFMGMASFSIAGVTILHALTYGGMPVLPGHSADLPTQMWLIERYLTAAAFLIAPLFLGARLRHPVVALASFAAAAAVLLGMVALGIFPVAFVEGVGLTPFKVVSEYVIMAAFAGALLFLWQRRELLERDVFRLLAGSIVASIAAELLFTTYTDVYGITNMLGHLVYLLSTYLLYRALVDVVLERPYDAMFRELSQREAALREAHRFSEGINAVDTAINSTLDLDEIMRRVVVVAGEVSGADAVVLGLFDGDVYKPSYFYGYTGDEFGSITLDRDIGRHVFRAAESGGPIVISDTATDPNVSRELIEATGVRAILAAPVNMRDEPIGGLGFHWLRGPHQPSPGEIDFARRLTASLALATQNARLYAGEHDIAEALQTEMVSAAETVPGVDVGSVYAPAPGPGRIGGDFFDVFTLDADRLAFLLGDVSGRGLAAAATNAMTRSAVRALAYHESFPDLVLERASESLGRQLGDEEFVTAVFGILDTKTGEVEVAIAGHPDPIIAERPDLEPAAGGRCPPLGVPTLAPCPSWSFALAPGETLVLYTDGVIETRRGSEFFGSARLRDVITRAAGGQRAQDVADAVLAAVQGFAGGDLSDDLAVLAIRYEGAADKA